MRKIITCAWGLAAALLVTAPASAGQMNFTCDEFATAIADHATRGDMQRAGDFDQAKPGKVLVIGAGRKFYVPRYQNPGELAPKTVWQNLRNYNGNYEEAYWRCLNASSITINVKK